jgi:hypothetical protein
MALAQFALERFDDAMSSMLRVRHIRESQLGKKHPEIYEILNNLGKVKIGEHFNSLQYVTHTFYINSS